MDCQDDRDFLLRSFKPQEEHDFNYLEVKGELTPTVGYAAPVLLVSQSTGDINLQNVFNFEHQKHLAQIAHVD